MNLDEKILTKEARAGVIGLGYVGLPLAVEFAKAGFRVTGVDIITERVNSIQRGKCYIDDVNGDELRSLVKEGFLKATSNFNCLGRMDTINICVPTPLRKTRDPDVSYIVAATEQVQKRLRKDQLIILESTTYPGTTEELILPMLQSTGLKVGKDFFLAFSPERVDPGNKVYTTKNIPKVVGGVTPSCTKMASLFYAQSLKKVVPVSSTRVAEMVKLLENTFRIVNIALVNEIALMCDRMGMDVWEIIEAAKTKPFGFMPFFPGPGLGGHCIPIDPFYLSWKAKLSGFEARFIELAGQVNTDMPHHVVKKITNALNMKKKSVKGSRILILGVAYKADVNDARESPAIEIIQLLEGLGADVIYSDPYVPVLRTDKFKMRSVPITQSLLRKMDMSVVVSGHSNFDYKRILSHSPLVLDTRNVFRNVKSPKIVKL
ncbi:MAG: nucleotide sugar dehydrogenase [Candidatus Eisenbacteria bacterium]|nr:nucleotide sugar dehydrogenase [Candidatus Eisenbacteria bacterium]